MSAGTAVGQTVLSAIRNGVGTITLNRPKAINALDHKMVSVITATLGDWSEDGSVRVVLLQGAGERGFCAGGDIRAIYQDAKSGGQSSLDFWRDEYRLNAMIADYPKPVVAFMDGLVMGGGVGLSSHASHRVVTDRSIVAMPEVNIGMIPDVGGTYLLAKSPGWLGLHAGLTGTRLGAADVIALGMADHYVDHRRLAELAEQIGTLGVEAALTEVAAPRPTSEIAGQQDWIDRCYDSDSAVQIIADLRAMGVAAATSAADAICAASPLSVIASLRAIRSVRLDGLSLKAALNQEFRMVSAAVRSADLVEGIRAQVIDKDRRPAWSPATLGDVSEAAVERYFQAAESLPFPDPDS